LPFSDTLTPKKVAPEPEANVAFTVGDVSEDVNVACHGPAVSRGGRRRPAVVRGGDGCDEARSECGGSARPADRSIT
jgi:hypothetical protein